MDIIITGSIPLPTLSELFYYYCCLLLLPCCGIFLCFTISFIAELLVNFIIDRSPLRVDGDVLIH